MPEAAPRIITHADGIWIWDAEGNKLLDGMSGLWCVNVGYGRKELAEAAYRQMLDLPYYNTFFKTLDGAGDRACRRRSRPSARALQPHVSSSTPARRPTTPSCASCATTGR